ELTVTVDGHPARKFLIHPKRKWKVHFIHHSHLDIGYSDTIAAVTKGQARNLAKAIEYADMTQDWPRESRFHWTVESSWIVEQYLAAGGDVEHLREAIRRGQIEIAASYAGVYYDNCIDEMLLRQFYKVREFEELLGAAAGACMVTDIPGWPRGLAEALVDVGVPYLDASPHYLYAAPPDDFERPCIFYLKAHDTEKRALTWYSIYHYQQGNAGLKLFKGRSALEPHLANRLEHIARAGYSYDAYQVRIQGEFADNSKPNLTTSKTIRQWNERWAYPKLIFSTNQEVFGYMEREYGDQIPTVAGDISDWWVRGTLCYPIQTALDRSTQRRLVEAETLASMARLWNPAFEYPAEKIASAYQDTIIWKEHTHGYFAGRGEKNEEIWAGKKRCVEAAGRACDEATSESVEALKAAFAGPEPGVLVVNTRSWPVEGYVEVAAPAVPDGCELKDPESAAPVSCCRLEGGSKIRFWAKVPALAAKVYQVVECASAAAPSDLKVGEAELE
ncbi:MAG: hypothetical protein QF662_07235, partial [Phycisphaerae bacterium]|nr:hypothetical protein [Phycisphaerae bacterium]